ncbi:MAG: hypothetical protein J6Y02_04465 [Pseudobutyrivibrio sp.]|nr:hypothetical protein [Pseudobutyrivibrio sp.]
MAQLFDPARTFAALKKSIKDGVEETFPVETDKRILTISNVRVDDSKTLDNDYKTQKEIKLKGKDFVAPVYGDITLKDKETGEVIDSRRNFRIMDIPVMTDRYSYILGGNEYTVDKQLRMKPGIYTREKENGELESQFNLAKGGGRGFKLWINPEDGIFKLKIGTANPPLFPLLKALGVEDSKIKEAWGDRMYDLNASKTRRTSDNDIMKSYKAIFQKDASGIAQATMGLRDFFDKTLLSAETTQRTLGKGFDKVEPETLLLTSKRLLEVSRGEAEPDDRDSLVYKNIYDTPDLVKARIDASHRKVQNDIKRIMDKKNKVTEIVSKDMLNKPVRQFFVQGTVAHQAEQENPATILSEVTKVTSLGEGAIGDMNAITESMRDVNSSHAGVLDPVATPESDRIGINLHLALGAAIDNKELQTLAKDLHTGKTSYMNIKDIFDKKVAFPDQFHKDGTPVNKDHVMVLQSGKITEVKPSEVDVVMNSPKQMFSYLSNMVPFGANIQGNRAFMANKMLAQAIPLKYREAPLVQNKMPTGNTYEKFIGSIFSTASEIDGTVTEVTPDAMKIRDEKGDIKTYPLYNNFPLNNKSFVHSTPLVHVGDKVTIGQPLADTSYTKDGTLAIGTNLRVGYLPFRDTTFEDGYTISESAAKKLTSEHLRESAVQLGKEDLMDLKSFRAHYPTAMTGAMADKLDEEGVIRVGQRVEPGDVLIAHLQKSEASEEDARLGKLSKKLVKGFRNDAQIWDKNTVGVVTDVYKDDKGIKVFVRTEEPAQIGDKIVNRHGAKGIVSAIIPDKEMPMNKDGRPLDVAVSPSAIPGRINPSQIFEAAAGKIAEKWGRPIKIDNFAEHNTVKELKGLLKDEGLSDKEELIDPTNGQSLGKVMVGDSYYMKLMHQVDKKINARGVGPGYDINMQPTKGGHTSARALDRLTWNNLIAHGAKENLYEMTNYKSEKNPELWRNIELGLPLPAPKTPFVFDKLMGYLSAGGVNVKKEGNKLAMLPMTDTEILSRSNGEIDDARVVVSKNIRPVKDGLFDESKTGGLTGNKWTHVHLAEPVLNPVMEGAALSLLDMTQAQLNDLNKGKLYYDPTKKELVKEDPGSGLTAGFALESMLSDIDVDKELKNIKEKSGMLKGQGLDKANKKMRFLRALQSQDLKPQEAYMMHNVPILPPQFRPMYPMPNGAFNTAPINFLYRDMIMVNRQLKDLSFLDDDSKAELRGDLYQSVKAIQGLGDPLVQRGEKKIIGAIETIKGAQPKTGFFQSVVFSKNQDLSGSSTITPSTDMSPNEILLPRDMAWNLYKPFTIKELVGMGYKPLDAKVMVENKDSVANMALEKVSRERPVWLNRAPTLHKFGIMAFQPRLYDGKSIGIHPTVCGGYTADFDGDCSIGATFVVVDTKKYNTDSIDSQDKNGIINNESFQNYKLNRRAEMPSLNKLPLLREDAVVLHVNLEDFPRIEESKQATEKGTIVYKVPDGISIITIDNATHKPILSKVNEFSIHPDLEAYSIECNDNNSLILSSDHSAIAWDPDSMQLCKVKPSDVEGYAIPKIRNVDPVCSNPDKFYVFEGDYFERGSKALVAGTPLDSDFGYFIGIMVGDGWVSDWDKQNLPCQICLANVSSNIQKSFLQMIGRLLPEHDSTICNHVKTPHEFKGYASYSEKMTVCSAALAPYIMDWIGSGAENKHLPPFYLAAPREFREGLLAGLIDTDGASHWAKSAAKHKPQYTMYYSTTSIRLAEEVITLARSLGIKASITEAPKATGTLEYRVNLSALTLHDVRIPLLHETKASALKEYQDIPLDPEAIKMIATREDLVPFSPSLFNIFVKKVGAARNAPKEQKSLYTSLNRFQKMGYVPRITAEKAIAMVGEEKFPHQWIDVVRNTDVTWVYATKVTKLSKKITMYDITAPGPYTFMTASGIIVQDTMGIYVPVSHKAVEEAKQFMPTKLLEHAADSSIMLKPGHDIMLGMYYITKDGKDLSGKYNFSSVDDAMKLYKTKEIDINDTVNIGGKKTSIGKELVNNVIPSDVMIPKGGLTKSSIKAFLKDLSKKGSETFNDSIDKLSKLSAKYDLYSSISLGLDDLEPDYAARDKLVKETEDMMMKAKTDDDKRKIIAAQLPKFDATVKSYISSHPDTSLSQLMTANGKPSFDQYKQLISTPFAVSDVSGKAFPVITTKSYAEGLPVSEYWATTYGARTGMIQKRLETAEPGYFAKQVISTTINNVISEEDCGSKDGVTLDLEKKNDVVGRFEAGTNILIDENEYTKRLQSGAKSIKLRSPLTCNCKEGTCSKCYGLRENGKPAQIGDNIGALAGTFFSEPMTQGSMKAFHSGAVLGAGAAVSGGLQRMQQLTLVPEYLKDKATLAKLDGKVDSIEDNPAGGKNIFINGERHLTGAKNLLNVHVGDTVHKGDALTDGPIKPQELLELKGIESTQKYLVDAMQDTFAGMGKEMNRKLIETVVKSTTNLTTIKDPGNHPFYVAGDQVPLSEVKNWNLHRQNEIDLDMALGGKLAVGVGPFRAGKVLDKNDIKLLRADHIDKVIIESAPIKHTPSIVGMNLLARMGRDWLSNMNTNYIEQGIVKSVQNADMAPLHSYNPTGPYVMGTQFGKGEKGKY